MCFTVSIGLCLSVARWAWIGQRSVDDVVFAGLMSGAQQSMRHVSFTFVKRSLFLFSRFATRRYLQMRQSFERFFDKHYTNMLRWLNRAQTALNRRICIYSLGCHCLLKDYPTCVPGHTHSDSGSEAQNRLNKVVLVQCVSDVKVARHPLLVRN